MPICSKHLGRLAVLICCAGLASAEAAIYKYVDADGNVTFTDKFRPGAKKVADTADSPVTRVEINRKTGKAASTTAGPADFPKVDVRTQRKRDDVRQMILIEERAAELRNLAATRDALLPNDKQHTPGDQAKLREKVRRHEKNIELLDKELAHLK